MRHIKLETTNNFSHNKSNKKYSIKPLSILSAAVLCASSSFSIANSDTKCETCNCSDAAFYADHALLRLQPEVGIDFGFAKTHFKNKSMAKMLNRNQFPINVFFGLNFTEKFGVEFGYTETRRKHKDVTFGPGEFVPSGEEVPADCYRIYDTSLSTSQPYLSLKYQHPVGEKLKFFGAVGIVAMKINTSWKYIDNNGMRPPNEFDVGINSDSIETRKNIPLIKAGIYYKLNEDFSMRFITTWLQSSKLKQSQVAAKNSINLSIGIIYLI